MRASRRGARAEALTRRPVRRAARRDVEPDGDLRRSAGGHRRHRILASSLPRRALRVRLYRHGLRPAAPARGGREWVAEQLWVCAGDDVQTLFPGALGEAGLVACKLQMMRSARVPWRLG